MRPGFEQWLERVKDGRNYLHAGDDLGIPRATTYSWWKRALKLGLVDPESGPVPGPVPRLTREEREKRTELLIRMVTLNGVKVEDAAHRLHMGVSTAERYLQERGLSHGKLKAIMPGDPVAWDDLVPDGRRCLEDFGRFRQKVLGRSHNPPWARIVARQLLELYHSPDDEYVVVNAPPGIGKSMLITHDFVIWLITLERAKGGEPTVLLGHRSWQKATWYVKRIRTTLNDNATLVRTYGRFRPEDKFLEWSAEELRIPLLHGIVRHEKEPTITAGSYDASLLSGRFKTVVWDDLIDKTNSATADQREKLSEWNDNEAESRLEPGGLYIISNARFGAEDLSFTVTQQVDEEDVDEGTGRAKPLYKRIRMPAHDDTKCNGTEHTGPWPDGCLLDPVRVTWKRLRRQLAKSEGRYLLVWQQEDTDPTGNLAERVWFEGGKDSRGALAPGCFDHDRSYGQLKWPLDVRAPILSAVSLDPSSSKYWAMAHYLGYADREHVVHRALRRPLQAPDILYIDEDNPGGYVGLLEEWWQASVSEGVPFHYFIMEINAAQKWAMQYPFFTRWAASREVAIIPHTTTGMKVDADRGVEMQRPIYQFGRVRIPYGGYEEKLLADTWRREACSWPEGATSDLVMQHWFYVHRMDMLAATEVFETSEPDTTGIPEWVLDSAVPTWVAKPEQRKSLDRGTTLVRG
jgi:hypothetical protein